MDVDTSFNYAPSSSAPGSQGPLSAAPTITAFNFRSASFEPPSPISAAPTVTTFNNLFYDVLCPPRNDHGLEDAANISGISGFSESPCQPFPKKRRSSSPDPKSMNLRRSHQHLFEDEDNGYSSSPAPSSPSVHKLERMASNSLLANQKKPISLGLGMPATLALNANKKRPRRPALSAMIAPGEGPMSSSPHPQTAYPIMTNAEDQGMHRLPPARRAFSAMLPPNLLEQSMSSESSFEQDPDLSSPAQAYAKRQQVKTIRRCDGTDDFRPLTGATALMNRDTEIISSGRGLRRSEEREDRAKTVADRDTPRSKYLNAGPGLGGFGDNEAHGKILPCHRVREDGLMRINPTTVRSLYASAYGWLYADAPMPFSSTACWMVSMTRSWRIITSLTAGSTMSTTAAIFQAPSTSTQPRVSRSSSWAWRRTNPRRRRVATRVRRRSLCSTVSSALRELRHCKCPMRLSDDLEVLMSGPL